MTDRTAAMARQPAAGAILTIDVDAIVDNWRLLDRFAQPATAAAVVKADCYGLGAATIVPRLLAAGCRVFFVAELGEALALKPILGEEAALYVLNGVLPGSEAEYADANIHPVLSSLAQCRAWARLAAAGRELPSAMLQVDTGMSRLGLDVAEQEALAADDDLRLALGLTHILSHLANADEPMHAGNGHDRGGNRFQVNLHGRGINLHALWDSGMLDTLGLDEEAWLERLRQRPAPAVAAVAAAAPLPPETARAWAEHSCRIATAPGAYPDGHVVGEDYIQAHLPLLEAQLRLAGARLAEVLNAALGDG